MLSSTADQPGLTGLRGRTISSELSGGLPPGRFRLLRVAKRVLEAEQRVAGSRRRRGSGEVLRIESTYLPSPSTPPPLTRPPSLFLRDPPTTRADPIPQPPPPSALSSINHTRSTSSRRVPFSEWRGVANIFLVVEQKIASPSLLLAGI